MVSVKGVAETPSLFWDTANVGKPSTIGIIKSVVKNVGLNHHFLQLYSQPSLVLPYRQVNAGNIVSKANNSKSLPSDSWRSIVVSINPSWGDKVAATGKIRGWSKWRDSET